MVCLSRDLGPMFEKDVGEVFCHSPQTGPVLFVNSDSPNDNNSFFDQMVFSPPNL